MVLFHYDYASPWSYLAFRTIETALADTGATIEYAPVYLRGLDSFRDRMPYTPAKLRYIGIDFLRCAQHLELAVQIPAIFPINGLYALRGDLAARQQNRWREYADAMFEASWKLGRDVSKPEVVSEIAGEAGLDLAHFADAVKAPALKEDLKSRTAEAAEAGVFGVPSVRVGDELFWGHDRLDFARRAILAQNA